MALVAFRIHWTNGLSLTLLVSVAVAGLTICRNMQDIEDATVLPAVISSLVGAVLFVDNEHILWEFFFQRFVIDLSGC